jgi:pimeloyl-ACP methyl ester carboxylesterase
MLVSMTPVPTVLIPGLLCTPRLFAEQLPALWRYGPVTVARHCDDDTMTATASRILATAPPRFALAGLSMGGYLAFEIIRQAGDRVTRLALLNTSPYPDTADKTKGRQEQVAMARDGRFAEVVDLLAGRWLSPARRDDPALLGVIRQMAGESGTEAFARQQHAIITRPDSRPGLPAITCPTLVVAGEKDEVTVPEHAREMADRIPDARLVTIPDCGHLSTLEQPAPVTAALTSWLAGG